MGSNDIDVALVTGASSGIGRATAKRLTQAGYRVFGTSRKASAESSDGITMLICDVTDDASVLKAATDAAPTRRYAASKLAHQVSFMRRFLPQSMVDKNLRKYSNLPI